MKIKFVYGIFPALIFYTGWIKEGFAGVGNAMVIRIFPAHKDDEGLLQHVLTHVKQAYRFLIIFHALLYLFNADYREAAEVEAYRKQLEYSGDKETDIARFAGFICAPSRYRLQLNQPDVENMLREA